MSEDRKTHGYVQGRPYSAAVSAGGLMFVSGAVAVDGTGATVGSDVRRQTEQVLKNLRSVVEAAGASWDKVVKVTVYLNDMATFSEMNAAYTASFAGEPPARTTVGVSGLSKPEFLVEIDIVVASA